MNCIMYLALLSCLAAVNCLYADAGVRLRRTVVDYPSETFVQQDGANVANETTAPENVSGVTGFLLVRQDPLSSNLAEKLLQSFTDQMKILATNAQNYRTCNDIRMSHPSAISGYYFIDPDGPSTGDDPVVVYCNIEKGTTVVFHQDQVPIQEINCPSPGCYSKQIHYEASLRQIAALVALSGSCQQCIQYDCFASPLHVNNEPYAWWTDINGKPSYYWSGNYDPSNNISCQCGIEKTCIDPSVRCNCDLNSQELLSDKGCITDMSRLPITKLNFGTTSIPTSRGVYHLQPLECSGKRLLPQEPSSCADLWQLGHALPSTFTVKIRGKLKSVYCNFQKLPWEKGFQTELGFISRPSSVYFHYYLQSNFATVNVPIPFTRKTLNIGNAYDASGVFTAPVAGVYHFQFMGLSLYGAKEDSKVCIRKANVNLSCAYASSSPAQWETMAISVTTELQEQDKIAAYLVQGSIHANDIYAYTFFSGFLLDEKMSD